MRLRNVLFIVEDIEKSKQFYQEILGLIPLTDFGSKVVMSEGLVLQEGKICRRETNQENILLYFEEGDMKKFWEKIFVSKTIVIKDRLFESEDGRLVIRFYDPDGYLIEVGETKDAMQRRKGEY